MTLLAFILSTLRDSPGGLTSKQLAIRYTNQRDGLTSLPSAAGHVRRAIGANPEYFARPSVKFFGANSRPVSLTEEGRRVAEEIASMAPGRCI